MDPFKTVGYVTATILGLASSILVAVAYPQDQENNQLVYLFLPLIE